MDIKKMCTLPGPNHIHEIGSGQKETCYDPVVKPVDTMTFYKTCAAGLSDQEQDLYCCGFPALCGEF